MPLMLGPLSSLPISAAEEVSLDWLKRIRPAFLWTPVGPSFVYWQQKQPTAEATTPVFRRELPAQNWEPEVSWDYYPRPRVIPTSVPVFRRELPVQNWQPVVHPWTYYPRSRVVIPSPQIRILDRRSVWAHQEEPTNWPLYHLARVEGRLPPPGNYSRKSPGQFRVANQEVAGYVVYIGVDGLVDYTQEAGFSTTLGFSIPVTLPAVGTRVYHVVVRSRDQYGLESQNQYETLLYATPAGASPSPPPNPQTQQILVIKDGSVVITTIVPEEAVKEGISLMVWAGLDPSTGDPPLAVVSVPGKVVKVTLEGLPVGTNQVLAALVDNTVGGLMSGVLVSSVIVPEVPNEVEVVPGRGTWQ